MKTIARNRAALIADIFARATDCRAYSLSNGFAAAECSAEHIKSEFLNGSKSVKMTDKGDGSYRVRVHSNLWFEFVVPA